MRPRNIGSCALTSRLANLHGEASYEGRIFLNNPKADAETPKDLAHGYAGSFHIFGHGGCLGDVGHCEVSQHNRESYDFRSPHPLTPAKKRVCFGVKVNSKRPFGCVASQALVSLDVWAE